jgi:hypothetical protein
LSRGQPSTPASQLGLVKVRRLFTEQRLAGEMRALFENDLRQATPITADE